MCKMLNTASACDYFVSQNEKKVNGVWKYHFTIVSYHVQVFS